MDIIPSINRALISLWNWNATNDVGLPVSQSVCLSDCRPVCLWCLPRLLVSISTWSTRRALLRSLSGCASHLHWLRICSGSIFVVHLCPPSTLSLLSHFTLPLSPSLSLSTCLYSQFQIAFSCLFLSAVMRIQNSLWIILFIYEYFYHCLWKTFCQLQMQLPRRLLSFTCLFSFLSFCFLHLSLSSYVKSFALTPAALAPLTHPLLCLFFSQIPELMPFWVRTMHCVWLQCVVARLVF